jgi:hypothetical protein
MGAITRDDFVPLLLHIDMEACLNKIDSEEGEHPAFAFGWDTSPSTLKSRIGSRRASVCFLGMGYTGLPLCLRAAEAGYAVTGLDIDEERILTRRSKIDWDMITHSVRLVLDARNMIPSDGRKSFSI